MKIRTLLCISLIGIAAVLMGGCTTGLGTDKAPTLRVGISADYPPIIFRQGNHIVGVEADLAKALAASLGMQLEYVLLRWEDQINALNAGQTDIIMSGMSVTRARQLRVEFCDSYLRNGLAAAVPADAIGSYRTTRDVLETVGYIGAVRGTTGETFVKQNFPNADLVLLNKLSDAPYQFAGRRFKVFIHDIYAIAWLVSENETDYAGVWHPLTDEDLAWAVRRGDPEFRKAVNDTLAGWRSDGTLDRILDRWIPARNQIKWPE